MKRSTQRRTLEVWMSDTVAKFHSELRVVTLWSKRDWAAESKRLSSKVLITLSRSVLCKSGPQKEVGGWGKSELQPFGMSSKAHSSEPTAAQGNLPQTMPGGMSNHNRNNLKCSSVLRCTLSPFLLCALQAKTESGFPVYSLRNLCMKKMQNSQSTSLLPPRTCPCC